MAAAHMSQGEFEDAEKLLQEAMSKVMPFSDVNVLTYHPQNNNDVDTLINMLVCLQHQRTSDELASSTLR